MKYMVIALAVLATLVTSAWGAGTGAPQSDATNIDSYIESLRADFRAGKVALVTEAMHFNDKESAVFWPIYRKYESEVTTLNDGRVALMKTYAEKFATLTNADAKTLAEKSLTLERARVDLKRKYFREFSKVLPALTVAKFFQLEYRLDLLVNVQLASELPLLAIQPSADSSGQNPH